LKLDDTFLIADSVAPQFSENEILVAALEEKSYVAGPGERAVIWLAGCHRRCPGCFQPQYFSFDSGSKRQIHEIADRILSIEGIDGVTFSGGEPFEQYRGLTCLCRILKQNSQLSLLSYTGYRFEWLLDRIEQYGELLSLLDILIDGEFRENEAAPYLWRGSRNQRVIDLNVLSESNTLDPQTGKRQEIQLSITPTEIVIMGFPDKSSTHQLLQAMNRRGVILRSIQEITSW
jgi:anaerobic ribonucleoside-triphosphate reductase activating protein